MNRWMTIWLAAAALLPAAAAAQGDMLLVSPDAKTLGAGGVAMTTLSASHAIYNNAAASVFSTYKSQLSSSYLSQRDRDYYTVSGYYNFDSRNLVQAGWRKLHLGEEERDMSFDLGYSRRIGDRWAVGVTGRLYHLNRTGDSADALAVDLCALYRLPLENIGHYTTLRAGAKLGNLGGRIAGVSCTLPTNFTVGAAFDTYITDAHEVTLAVDLGYCFTPEYVRGVRCSVGAEYNLMQLIQLRAGYHVGERQTCDTDFASLGAGIRFMHIRVDFAYLFARRDTPFRNACAVSFGLDF